MGLPNMGLMTFGSWGFKYGTCEYGTCEYGTPEYGTCDFGELGDNVGLACIMWDSPDVGLGNIPMWDLIGLDLGT